MSEILTGQKYPKAEIEANYKEMLLNQFHDILPGSSIKKVYLDAAEQYDRIEKSSDSMIQNSIQRICGNDCIVDNNKSSDSTNILAFNPNSFNLNMPVIVDDMCHVVQNIPSFGFKAIPNEFCKNTINCDLDNKRLENQFFDIKFDANGDISYLYDKAHDKQVTLDGTTVNRFVAYEDIPYQ